VHHKRSFYIHFSAIFITFGKHSFLVKKALQPILRKNHEIKTFSELSLLQDCWKHNLCENTKILTVIVIIAMRSTFTICKESYKCFFSFYVYLITCSKERKGCDQKVHGRNSVKVRIIIISFFLKWKKKKQKKNNSGLKSNCVSIWDSINTFVQILTNRSQHEGIFKFWVIFKACLIENTSI
jgi:hypothetical protein